MKEEYEEISEDEKLTQKAGIAGALSQQTQAAAQSQYYMQEQDRTLAEAQLEVETILNDIYRTLRQDIFHLRDDESIEWVESPPIKRALTDEGVERIMQVMKSYVNKNTLLSNFTEEQIKRRMFQFSLALNGNIFQKYEVYFKEPTIEECREILRERIEQKIKIKSFARELLGLETDKEEIKNSLLKEIEKRVEDELEIIRIGVRKRNLKEYELLFRQMESIVEATHNRAYRGEERGSLRRHMNVSEVIGERPNSRNSREAGGIFKWIKG